MKKSIFTFIMAMILCLTISQPAFVVQAETNPVFMELASATPPNTQNADAAMLVDMNSGRLLYGKNIDKKVFPASTTKIMTGILAIEMGNFEEIVTASYEAIAPITMDDSQIGIRIGEKLSMEQLVNALLIPSANDAANVIAVHLAGSMDGFVELMNKKAAELGMTNTHFVNTCGMHDDNHYTTVRDLSVLAQYAMKNETFRNIVKTSVYKIPPTNKYEEQRILTSTNLFLSSAFHKNPYCVGIKTGRTSKAGYCLVSSAQKDGMYLLSVVMGCDNADTEANAYSYTNSKSLFDFAYKNYVNKVVAAPDDVVHTAKVYEAKKKTPVNLTVDNTINALVPTDNNNPAEIETSLNLPEKIPAPITAGSVLGTVTYSYNGSVLGTANLVAINDVERNEFIHIIHIIGRFIINPWFFIPAIILLIILHLNRKARIKKKQRKERRKQYMEE